MEKPLIRERLLKERLVLSPIDVAFKSNIIANRIISSTLQLTYVLVRILRSLPVGIQSMVVLSSQSASGIQHGRNKPFRSWIAQMLKQVE